MGGKSLLFTRLPVAKVDTIGMHRRNFHAEAKANSIFPNPHRSRIVVKNAYPKINAKAAAPKMNPDLNGAQEGFKKEMEANTTRSHPPTMSLFRAKKKAYKVKMTIIRDLPKSESAKSTF
jgi:hypothetical protein